MRAMPYDNPSFDTQFLETLNKQQKEAVIQTEGPLLILAGAGTGKTKVLTSRIAYLIAHKHIFPSKILAVTFTNKAANEMKQRVENLLGQPTEGLWMGTFHSLALRMLRTYCELVGLKPGFTILDIDDQLRMIKQIMGEQGIDPKKIPPKYVLGIIERWKDKAFAWDQLTQSEMSGKKDYAMLYRLYQDRLQALNAVDFGDLLLYTIRILQQHQDVLETYQKKFHYILVDEYQDTNVAQYLWLRLLSQGRENLCCVGDDDQAIYGWRGAEVENILRFPEDFPNATIIRLQDNYRSTSHILGAASGIIAHNNDRLGKTLYSTRDEGPKVHIQETRDAPQEARFIGRKIEHFYRQGHPLKSNAVLVRSGFQTRELEEYFFTMGLPYRVIGGLKFYERQESKDAVAYLRAIVNPSDSLAFERIINLPKRGIGATSLRLMHSLAYEESIPLAVAAYKTLERGLLKNTAAKNLQALLTSLEEWRHYLPKLMPSELGAKVLEESGYLAMWQDMNNLESAGRIENLREFIRALDTFETIEDFLEHVSLVIDNQDTQEDDQATIMTLHAAKGLEFDHVFLCGWEEGIFPSPRSVDEKGQQGLEEERRLAYVGITRAKRHLFISYALRRFVFGSYVSQYPSRFLKEIPKDHCMFHKHVGDEYF